MRFVSLVVLMAVSLAACESDSVARAPTLVSPEESNFGITFRMEDGELMAPFEAVLSENEIEFRTDSDRTISYRHRDRERVQVSLDEALAEFMQSR